MNKPLTVPAKQIIRAVAAVNDVEPKLFLKAERVKKVHADARNSIWVALRNRGYSYQQIGSMFGRHHTTVMHGINDYLKKMEAA